MIFTFDVNGDFKTEFKNAVTRLVRVDIDSDAQKVALVQRLTDTYVGATGERPEVREMDELSSWLIFGRKGVSQRKMIEIKALTTAEGAI